MLSILIGVALGAAVGGAVGYAGKCADGFCVLMGSPLRGMITGAILGLLVAGSFRFPASQVQFTPSRNFVEIQSQEQLASLLQQNRVVLVDFYADWCGPCRMLKPVLHELADEYGETVRVSGVNIDRLPELARQFEVDAVPRVVIFQNGQPVNNLVGFRTKQSYAEVLSKLSKTPG